MTGQLTRAQDITKILTPGGELTPEAQRALSESQQFKTLTPEEIERGKAELEKREKEGRLEEKERIEKERKEEKEAKRIEELSNQEKELRYIFNKYKDRTFRDMELLISSFIKDQLVKNNINVELKSVKEQDLERLDLPSFERELNQIDYGLIDILDRYQEDVINDVIYRFQLKSAFYRDATKKMRDIFNLAKTESIAQIEAYVLGEIRNGRLPLDSTTLSSTQAIAVSATRTGEVTEAQTITSADQLHMIFRDFMDRVIKEIQDNFTLKWAVKDIIRPYEEELTYTNQSEDLKHYTYNIMQ
jgi:hypothetical protein